MSVAKVQFRKQREKVPFEFLDPRLANHLDPYARFVFTRIAFPGGTPCAVRKNGRFYPKGDLNLVGLREHAEGEQVIGVSLTQGTSGLTKAVCFELPSTSIVETLGQACRLLRTCENGSLPGAIEICPDDRIRTWIFFPEPLPSHEALSAVRRFKKESFITQKGGLFPLENSDSPWLELPPHLDRQTGKWSRVLTLEESESFLEGDTNLGECLNWVALLLPESADGGEHAGFPIGPKGEGSGTRLPFEAEGGNGASGGEESKARVRREPPDLELVPNGKAISLEDLLGSRDNLENVFQESAPRSDRTSSSKHSLDPTGREGDFVVPNLVAKPLSDSIPGVIGRLLDPTAMSIPTPSGVLNDTLNGGWMVQHLYLLAGPSGEGKTTFCSWICDSAASREVPVLFVSFQLPTEQMAIYSLSRTARVDSAKIESRQWLDTSRRENTGLSKKLISAGRRFFQTAGFLHFSEAGSDVTTMEIETALRRVRENAKVAETEPILVVVDSLCEVRSQTACGKPAERTPAEIAQVMLELKRLAWKNNAAVIATLDVPVRGLNHAEERLRESVQLDPRYIAAAPMADTAFVLDSRSVRQVLTGVEPRNREDGQMLDPLDRILAETGNSSRLEEAIRKARGQFPLDPSVASTYARLVVMKNRGGGTDRQPVFRYERAYHDFEPIDLEELQTSRETAQEAASAA
jgi:archaellum biogenesis ATPase FlaH